MYNLTVTDDAKAKIKELMAGVPDDIHAVRIFVSGGGCGGMEYGMTFADEINWRDTTVLNEDKLKLVIDPVALAYMDEAEVDYQNDGMNESFVFNNVFKSVGGSGSCGGCGGAM